jgi:hypothetical protein
VTERQELLKSIAETTADYRAGDLTAPTPEHVDRWVKQFNADVQLPILREMDHVLKNTYFSLNKVTSFLKGLVKAEKFVGSDPSKFWRSVHFLDIQEGGNSQRDMLAMFGQLLKNTYGVEINQCGQSPESFIYLDDAIFTGNRVQRDLKTWIQSNAPAQSKINVVSIALHSGGQYYANKCIQSAANAVGKSVNVTWWRAIQLEDRLSSTNSSDVLRPTSIPEVLEVKQYVEAMKYKPKLRVPGNVGSQSLFSSEEGRNLLEQEFLKAGVKIRQLCPHLGETQRPLGHITLETLGFGSLIVTFRNCPNNAPLALWAGDPWYPLFARTTNSQTSLKRFMAMLAEDGFDGI